jgi:hypothetical protein
MLLSLLLRVADVIVALLLRLLALWLSFLRAAHAVVVVWSAHWALHYWH